MSRPAKWNCETVAQRLEEAAQTMRRLPKVKAEGYKCFWPEVVRESFEGYGWEAQRLRLGPPTARHISEMDEVLSWYLMLDKHCAKVVYLRSVPLQWKQIQKLTATPKQSWSRNKLLLDYKASLVLITHNLNNPRLNCVRPYRALVNNPAFG